MKRNIARSTHVILFAAAVVVGMAGTAQAQVVFNPSSLHFGCAISGITGTCSPAPQTTTLINTGSKKLNLRGITITGSIYFSQTNNCGPSVAAGGSCAITVRFGPAPQGKYSGDISVYATSEASPIQVPLSGWATRLL